MICTAIYIYTYTRVYIYIRTYMSNCNHDKNENSDSNSKKHVKNNVVIHGRLNKRSSPRRCVWPSELGSHRQVVPSSGWSRAANGAGEWQVAWYKRCNELQQSAMSYARTTASSIKQRAASKVVQKPMFYWYLTLFVSPLPGRQHSMLSVSEVLVMTTTS